MNADYSEPELLEEEVDSWLLLIVGIWGVVSTAILELIINLPIGEDSLDLVLKSLLGLLVGNLVLGDDGLELVAALGELTSDEESSWEDVVIVHDLDEWLKGRSSGNLLLAHFLGHLEWGSLDTGNEGVWELFALLAIVEWLDDDGLLSSSSSGE